MAPAPDRHRSGHRVLAFPFQALAAEALSQEWHYAAHDKLTNWEVEYLNVRAEDTQHTIPCSLQIRHVYSEAFVDRRQRQSSCGRGNNRQSTKENESARGGRDNKQIYRKGGHCLHPRHGRTVNQDPLDKEYPNWKLHGGQKYPMGLQEFTRRLHCRIARNRTHGFEQLHKQHRLQAKANNYRHLRSLQGGRIPVCLGSFQPPVAYWYHDELMAEMMVLSWSGT
ncbi:uncharacterized protein N7515_000198 [Penicillium bovifimosum]|uniref:Uncharacterized protein n=1 Tax=Penicillium bovifimosum TaxID=126998 RepID=A0A9W9HEM5_9EURO|nr:uncharacterized protein N7515_000198 [Penicillium bovifimosum]KAJ5145634.1 hypothetical protein N7515_000198 [Penicillium bovifimosum]